ncbi:hypothetical protein [Streptomyces sp. ST1020]|uniref:hypothetical protein n=1 Tax=Streptomyces sp. ST1020 TaxID=1848901 RepID=UPI0013A6927B|nr:hypothetical protein [Streptomyces sp. ST1020]
MSTSPRRALARAVPIGLTVPSWKVALRSSKIQVLGLFCFQDVAGTGPAPAPAAGRA